jgi:hypothetical protein
VWHRLGGRKGIHDLYGADAPAGAQDDARPNSANRFRLESLEPRLLLSGELNVAGLALAAPTDLQEQDHNATVLVLELESTAPGASETTSREFAIAWPEGWETESETQAETADALIPSDENPAEYIGAEDGAAELQDGSQPDAADQIVATPTGVTFSEEIADDRRPRGPPLPEAIQTHDHHLAFDGPAAPDAGVTLLDVLSDAFNGVLQEARDLWTTFSNGAGLAGVLSSLTVELLDLQDNQLAEAEGGVISLDPTAAGRGWFVDPTPSDNDEFDISLLAEAGGPAEGRIDLLTVLLHEAGHLLGFPHGSQLDVMGPTLGLGERVLLSDLVIVDLASVADTAIIDVQINDDGTVDIAGAGAADGISLAGIALVIGNPNAGITLGGSNLDNHWKLGAGNTGQVGSATSFVAFQAIQFLEGGAAHDQIELRSGYSALTSLSTA